MQSYAILYNPFHTRVSYSDSRVIALKELDRALTQLAISCQAKIKEIAGIPYFVFDTHERLTTDGIRTLSRLSFTYALYEIITQNSDTDLLLPVLADSMYSIGDDISLILKYFGKTNELFTRFMLNLALWNTESQDSRLRILDPLAGKGTTLFEGLMYGADVYGVEIEQKPAHEAYIFFKKYLETAKIKHSGHTEKVGGSSTGGKRFSATRYQISVGNGKKLQPTQQFEIIAGDTRYVNTYFKKNFFDCIIGDLPYGVQHGSKTAEKNNKQHTGITRNASGLLDDVIPEWMKILRPDGIIVLAWNLLLIPKEEMIAIFIKNGLNVIECDFAHRVDQAIDRNVIVGRK